MIFLMFSVNASNKPFLNISLTFLNNDRSKIDKNNILMLIFKKVFLFKLYTKLSSNKCYIFIRKFSSTICTEAIRTKRLKYNHYRVLKFENKY
ncbi:hypothetical protein BpHYR1_037514 [Brachionus plicatilis]|uniref:Uncharacterized protein n=1 Tax=Brachionus plicatilis TaxID=10195 RepID=A0A3M7SQG1_BRAPC|nr:hypothetical protein BpHYR1_037514 [Brachionus plicatilis]